MVAISLSLVFLSFQLISFPCYLVKHWNVKSRVSATSHLWLTAIMGFCHTYKILAYDSWILINIRYLVYYPTD